MYGNGYGYGPPPWYYGPGQGQPPAAHGAPGAPSAGLADNAIPIEGLKPGGTEFDALTTSIESALTAARSHAATPDRLRIGTYRLRVLPGGALEQQSPSVFDFTDFPVANSDAGTIADRVVSAFERTAGRGFLGRIVITFTLPDGATVIAGQFDRWLRIGTPAVEATGGGAGGNGGGGGGSGSTPPTPPQPWGPGAWGGYGAWGPPPQQQPAPPVPPVPMPPGAPPPWGQPQWPQDAPQWGPQQWGPQPWGPQPWGPPPGYGYGPPPPHYGPPPGYGPPASAGGDDDGDGAWDSNFRGTGGHDDTEFAAGLTQQQRRTVTALLGANERRLDAERTRSGELTNALLRAMDANMRQSNYVLAVAAQRFARSDADRDGNKRDGFMGLVDWAADTFLDRVDNAERRRDGVASPTDVPLPQQPAHAALPQGLSPEAGAWLPPTDPEEVLRMDDPPVAVPVAVPAQGRSGVPALVGQRGLVRDEGDDDDEYGDDDDGDDDDDDEGEEGELIDEDDDPNDPPPPRRPRSR